MTSKNVKEIADWTVWCAKENCKTWDEPFTTDHEALMMSHDSTYMEDEKDMIEEMGFKEEDIEKAWNYLIKKEVHDEET